MIPPVTSTPRQAFEDAMAATLIALMERLALAYAEASDAADAMQAGDRNVAMGGILLLRNNLTDCAGLISAVIAYHHWCDSLPVEAGDAP